MDPLLMIAMMNAALSVIETLGPKIQSMISNNEITVDQQQMLLDRMNKLKDGSPFNQPHWQPSGIPKTHLEPLH